MEKQEYFDYPLKLADMKFWKQLIKQGWVPAEILN